MPARRALFGESIQIAVIYLSLTSLFFGVVSYFAGTSIRSGDATSFVGHSSMVDAISGILSFSLVSLTVLKFRKQTMVCNIVVCFCISSIISVIDFLAVMHVYKAFYTNSH